MSKLLAARIARIVAPNAAEIQLKRNARFGKLNVALAFDISGHVQGVDRRSDVRQEFARRVAMGAQ